MIGLESKDRSGFKHGCDIIRLDLSEHKWDSDGRRTGDRSEWEAC